jgi:hypothetical protein
VWGAALTVECYIRANPATLLRLSVAQARVLLVRSRKIAARTAPIATYTESAGVIGHDAIIRHRNLGVAVPARMYVAVQSIAAISTELPRTSVLGTVVGILLVRACPIISRTSAVIHPIASIVIGRGARARNDDLGITIRKCPDVAEVGSLVSPIGLSFGRSGYPPNPQ